MNELLGAQDSNLRFYVLVLALALVATWEGVAPRRSAGSRLRSRWLANFGVWIIDAALLRLAFPTFAVGFAVVVAQRGGGILPSLALPWWVGVALCLLAFDLGQYVEHWLFHRVPLLWRVHRVHHADPDYDFTLGLRFHPLEALCSASLTSLTIVVLGPPPMAVLTHQLLVAVNSMFAHGNVRLPVIVDDMLRRLTVTPDLHRVHHSAAMRESNSNLGNLFPWWDRLFGTYVDQPAAGHERMTIGLGGPPNPRDLKLGWMLLDPFRRETTALTPRTPAERAFPLSDLPSPRRSAP